MKKVPLCIVILFCLLACSDTETSENSTNESIVSEHTISFPLNPANPFDARGQNYYDALGHYLENNETPNSINEITQQLRFVSRYYKGSMNNKNGSLEITPEEVASILNNPSLKLFEVVENCPLNSESKADLLVFVQTLIDRQQQPYSEIRDFIISYDDAIIENEFLSTDDKESILTITSISSYALCAEYERKDKDWEHSAGTKKTGAFFGRNQAPLISIIALLKQFTE